MTVLPVDATLAAPRRAGLRIPLAATLAGIPLIFAIAGLIDNRVTQILNRVPGLGNIPILGQLFRSRSTQKTDNELLVVITPHFVRP